MGMTTNTNMIGAWISAFRLRTLPLALASIFLGSFLASYDGIFQLRILLLSALTTVLLQVLSNLANDYGDSINGADSALRQGPSRAVQSGAISIVAMKRAMGIFVFLAFASGVFLLYTAVGFSSQIFLIFIILGILAIMAAVFYTSGKRPYGYTGLGDLSVMVFFGFLGVLGTFYLHTGTLQPDYILLAATSGFFSTAVLNINNIRDIKSDSLAGKMSIPVRIGRKRAVHYHWFLLAAGWVCAIYFTIMHFQSPWQWMYLVSLPLFIYNAAMVSKKVDSISLDPFLKQMALSTLLFVLLFGAGLVIN